MNQNPNNALLMPGGPEWDRSKKPVNPSLAKGDDRVRIVVRDTGVDRIASFILELSMTVNAGKQTGNAPARKLLA